MVRIRRFLKILVKELSVLPGLKEVIKELCRLCANVEHPTLSLPST